SRVSGNSQRAGGAVCGGAEFRAEPGGVARAGVSGGGQGAARDVLWAAGGEPGRGEGDARGAASRAVFRDGVQWVWRGGNDDDRDAQSWGGGDLRCGLGSEGAGERDFD